MHLFDACGLGSHAFAFLMHSYLCSHQVVMLCRMCCAITCASKLVMLFDAGEELLQAN